MYHYKRQPGFSARPINPAMRSILALASEQHSYPSRKKNSIAIGRYRNNGNADRHKRIKSKETWFPRDVTSGLR